MEIKLDARLERALDACRQWFNTVALDGRRSTDPVLFATAVEALVDTTDYEVKRRARAVRDDENQGVPLDWTEAQWEEHNDKLALLTRIDPRHRLVVADAVSAGVLSLEDIRRYVLAGQPEVVPSSAA